MASLVLDRRQTSTKLRFIPVIFANAEDDDTVGLIAALEDKEVQFDDRIYRSKEDIIISGRTLILSRSLLLREDGSNPSKTVDIGSFDPNNCITVEIPSNGRLVRIERCVICSPPLADV